jgi:uncharacterized membrane protein YedE/YeeE
MARLLSALLAGLIFGAGLAISGMTNPLKVLAFLDVGGDWDPSLLFVLGGAVGVTAIAFRFILRRPAPLLDSRFQLPAATAIDRPLLVGSLLFGIGWGISGYCPGPAIALLATPATEALVFLPALLAGSWLQRFHAIRRPRPATTQPDAGSLA